MGEWSLREQIRPSNRYVASLRRRLACRICGDAAKFENPKLHQIIIKIQNLKKNFYDPTKRNIQQYSPTFLPRIFPQNSLEILAETQQKKLGVHGNSAILVGRPHIFLQDSDSST